MNPVATTFFFYFLAVTAIVSAIAVITRRNPVHAALSLIVTLLSLAGFYLMLYAPFVAGVQIVLYAGGIMVLFLFVIMLVNLEQNIREYQFNKQWMVGTIAALALGGLLLFVFAPGDGDLPDGVLPGYRGLEGRQHAADRPGAVRQVHAAVRNCVAAAAGGHRGRCGHGEEEDLRHGTEITTLHYLVVAAALFMIGTIGVLTRRNVIIILMSIELILNAVNLNLVAFSRLYGLHGQVFSIFVITDAAAEAAVGLGIIIAFFRNKETVNVDEVDLLKW